MTSSGWQTVEFQGLAHDTSQRKTFAAWELTFLDRDVRAALIELQKSTPPEHIAQKAAAGLYQQCNKDPFELLPFRRIANNIAKLPGQ
jgi:hypothetical protein